MPHSPFEEEFSEQKFWDKIKNYAKAAGEAVLEPALKMYYSAADTNTPVWARTTAYAALGYFIAPIDAIPDISPLIGYSDDLGVLVASAAAIAAHIKEEHGEKARQTLQNWFN